MSSLLEAYKDLARRSLKIIVFDGRGRQLVKTKFISISKQTKVPAEESWRNINVMDI